ncbi:MAG: hypothetical protein R2875_05510 [Desulfobacterales bacterium]
MRNPCTDKAGIDNQSHTDPEPPDSVATPKPGSGHKSEESLYMTPLMPIPCILTNPSRKTGLNVGRLSVVLLNLELKGLVVQSPGKYFNHA